MQLHSSAFEKALHAAARVELRKSPEKWRTYLWTYWSNPPGWVLLLVFIVTPLMLVAFFLYRPFMAELAQEPPTGTPVSLTGRLMTDLVLTWLLFVGLIFWLCLKQALQAPAQRLPVSQQRLFESLVAGHRRSLLLLAVLLGVAGTLKAWIFHGQALWQSAFLFGFLHIVNLHALGMAWACWVAGRPLKPPRAPNTLREIAKFGLIFGPFFFILFLPRWLDPEDIARFVRPVYAALPGGWVGELFFDSLEGRLGIPWAALPTIPLLLMLPVWHRKLRERFIRFAPDQQFVLRPDESPAEWTREQAEAQLRERLASPTGWWQAGWIERLVARALTPKERNLTEVMLPVAPGWSGLQQKFTSLVVALLGIGWFLQTQRIWISVLLYFFIGVVMMVWGYGLNLSGGRIEGTALPAGLPFLLPVTAWDYSRAWLKIVWVRSLCALPVFILAMIFLGQVLRRFELAPELYVLLVWLIGPVLAPVKPLSRVLGAIQPVRWWQWGCWLLSLPCLILTLAAPAIVVTSAMRESPESACLALAGIGVVLHCLLVPVNWALRRQWFDLTGSRGLVLGQDPSQQPQPVLVIEITPARPAGMVP